MRLAQLRHQMLIAMGLPACWTSGTPAPVSAPAQAAPTATPSQRVEPEIAMFDARVCTIDQIVETMCGRGTGDYCGATANTVELAAGSEGLYVTSLDDARTRAVDFMLDGQASEGYVTRLQSLNTPLDGKPGCCYSRCTTLVIGAARPLVSPMPAYHIRNEACIPAPPKGTSQPDANEPRCPLGVQIAGELRPYANTRDDKCCYVATQRRAVIQRGRPARVDGDPKFARLASSTAWHADAELEVMPDAALAAKWLAAAKLEHASVAAFSATSIRLMALGAPPALIAGAHRAALEEIEHARFAFAVASAYAGVPVSPAAFPDVRAQPMTLRELAIETFVDGCVGETVAALEAAREAAAESNPVIADKLRAIANEEATHAALAWQIVAWCVRQDRTILDELYADNADPDVMREVIEPCVAALAA